MKTNDSLEQLLSRFMEPHKARKAAGIIESGDRLFNDYPAPAVPGEAVTCIQERVKNELRRRHRTNRVLAWGSTAAAMAVILLAGLYTVFDPQAHPMSLSSNLGRSDNPIGNIWAERSSYDLRLTMIDTELTDIAESMDAIQSDNSGFAGSQDIDLMELEELELIASNTDFWKG